MPISKSAVYKILDLDLAGIPEGDWSNAKEEVLDYVKEQILVDLSRAQSPVTGEAFVALSPEYAKRKAEVSSAVIPNMELTGDLLDALVSRDARGSKIEVGWFDPDQAIKAFNHTTGDTVPKRPLIPDPKEDFRPEIMEGIKAILDGYRAS